MNTGRVAFEQNFGVIE